jgi:hypothetical protein
VLRLAVQRAVTKRTNCKSGMPGFWTSSDCIMFPLSTETSIESITGKGYRTTSSPRPSGAPLAW